MAMSDGGKGSSPRPYSVDQETFASNWDRIFGKKKTEETSNDSQIKQDIKQNESQTSL